MKSTTTFSLFTLFLVALSTLSTIHQARAQSAIELENVQASVQFGEQITFVATIKSSIPVQTVSIVIADESLSITRIEPVGVDANGHTEYRFDTKQNLLRPFTSLKWNYRFSLPDGSTTQSESFSVRYVDNRFNWQTLGSGTLQLHWYQGDASFGQAALDAAQSSQGSIGSLMTLDLARPVEIYIYASTDDLRGTLALSGEDWVAGHVDPALGVVMVVIAPGAEQNITMEQRIPHELMHVMMYRSVGAGYNHIPAWLREGTATLAEIYPNADYDRALNDALASNNLIPLEELCVSFPSDAGQAFLAYAESRSFTDYLHDTYGSTGLLGLVGAYADGVDCESGTQRAFGASFSSLDAKWRSSALGQNMFASTLQNIAAYLVLLCLVLIMPLVGIAMTLRKKGSSHEPGTSIRQ